MYIASKYCTNNSVNAEEQIIRHDSTHVRSKTVSDACGSIYGHTACPKKREGVCNTSCYGTHVVHRGRITWWLTQGAPVHEEHIVTTVTDIRCKQNTSLYRSVIGI